MIWEIYLRLFLLIVERIAEGKMLIRTDVDRFNELQKSILDSKIENAKHVSFESADSFYRQIYQKYVRKTHHLHKRPGSLAAIHQQRITGQTLYEIAQEKRFSSYLLARIYLENVYPKKYTTSTTTGTLSKSVVSKLIHEPELITDSQLRNEVIECTMTDKMFSPQVDAIRRDIGERYEDILYEGLRKREIPFQTENELRQQGMAKTPDALLEVPIGVLDSDGKPRVVNWIDSKGMFGYPIAHFRENMSQFRSYVNRYGPGMVIYWFDFVILPEDEEQLNKLPVSDSTKVNKLLQLLHEPLSIDEISAAETGQSGVVIANDLPKHYVFPGGTKVCTYTSDDETKSTTVESDKKLSESQSIDDTTIENS